MKIVFLTGNHLRHRFMASMLQKTGHLVSVIMENREDHVPNPPQDLSAEITELFVRHFAEREQSEIQFFSQHDPLTVPITEISIEDLNSPIVWDILVQHQPDLLLSYGVHKISEETLSYCAGYCWNIHGGLSPWYRGAITHFWPSYLLQPQMTGMTVHELDSAIDGGDIIHQTVGELVRGDGIHDLACRAVLALGQELSQLIHHVKAGKFMQPVPQKTTGRIWRAQDWRPEHLKLIYATYRNRIVDAYLDGQFKIEKPKLIRQF